MQAFGDITEHFHSFCHKYIDVENKDKKKLKALKKIWGESINSIDNIKDVFVSFLEGKINKLPWCEEFSTQDEISLIKDFLLKLNKNKIFTINSQPNANCVKSNDPYVGWGPSNGYVFQKCYIEFFISESDLLKLIEIINIGFSETIVYQCINNSGSISFY